MRWVTDVCRGAGPVGILAAYCAFHRGTERVLIIDRGAPSACRKISAARWLILSSRADYAREITSTEFRSYQYQAWFLTWVPILAADQSRRRHEIC